MVTKNRVWKMVNCRCAQNELKNTGVICTITSIYSNHRYGNHFVTILVVKKYRKNRCFPGADGIFSPFLPGAIDKAGKLCYILCVKSFDERHAFPERTSERSPFGARASVHCRDRYHFPSCGAEMPCRSRPLQRQWVTAKAVTRVEPWNTLYPTPDSVQGMGFFYTLSPK